jgi:hypothetical protein
MNNNKSSKKYSLLLDNINFEKLLNERPFIPNNIRKYENNDKISWCSLSYNDTKINIG